MYNFKTKFVTTIHKFNKKIINILDPLHFSLLCNKEIVANETFAKSNSVWQFAVTIINLEPLFLHQLYILSTLL